MATALIEYRNAEGDLILDISLAPGLPVHAYRSGTVYVNLPDWIEWWEVVVA